MSSAVKAVLTVHGAQLAGDAHPRRRAGLDVEIGAVLLSELDQEAVEISKVHSTNRSRHSPQTGDFGE